jgi:hypothetical protein
MHSITFLNSTTVFFLKLWEPDEALKKYENNEITFFPPQIYELMRMTRFNSIDKLSEYSLNRQLKAGVSTWQPKFVKIKGENYGLLPG